MYAPYSGDCPCLLGARKGVTCAGLAQTAGGVPKDATRRQRASRNRDRCVGPGLLLLVRLLLCRLGSLIRVLLGFLRGLVRFLVAHLEATQGLADALAALQPIEKRLGRDGGVLFPQVLRHHIGGNELAVR